MISKKYFKRAEQLLDMVLLEGENKYMREVLLSDTSLAKGNEDAAKDIWHTVPKENWPGQY